MTTILDAAGRSVDDAIAQLDLVVDALDAREQQRRGVDSHVLVDTDAQIRNRVRLAIAMLGGR